MIMNIRFINKIHFYTKQLCQQEFKTHFYFQKQINIEFDKNKIIPFSQYLIQIWF